MRHAGSRRLLLAAVFAVCAACGPAAPEDAPESAAPRAQADWDRMIDVEERLHVLRPHFGAVGRSIENLALPDAAATAHFDWVVEARDLAKAVGEPAPGPGDFGAWHQDWRPSGPFAQTAPSDLHLWEPLFREVSWFDHAELHVAKADFSDDSGTRLETVVELDARARLRGGATASFVGLLELRFARGDDDDPGDPASWKIDRIDSPGLSMYASEQPFFREVLDAALPDPAQRAAARRSRHEELARERLLDPSLAAPHPHFFVGSQDRHPGLSVVDIDSDGDDDLYAMARWGPNQLFVNDGTGHFDERAADWNLDIADHSAAALFADFDNDGDPDLFLGRTLAASRYLVNEGGRFVDRSAAVFGQDPPKLVASASAADVDGDGLLDLYVSTYAAQMLVADLRRQREKERLLGSESPGGLLRDYLPPEDSARLRSLAAEPGAHVFLSLPGPANRLYLNRGDGFERPGGLRPEESERNTYQATFSDFDLDGDPDLYLGHDFAPNQLLENDGAGRFEDVTAESGTADIGFGMGVSWGDYDRDGDFDLYVSNMESRAGQRITSSLAGIDGRLPKMARGNTLFRNPGSGDGQRFEVASREGDVALTVEKAGWSWGGQFGDVDSDGFEDLFVLSGYYTSPLDAEGAVDT